MTARKKDNARRGAAGKVGKTDSNQRRNHTPRGRHGDSLPEPVAAHHPHISTTAEAQRERIIAMLRNGRQSTLDFRRAGSMQSQTRIFELRAQGYDIATVGRVTAYDDQGYPHAGVALYELLAEPATGVQP